MVSMMSEGVAVQVADLALVSGDTTEDGDMIECSGAPTSSSALLTALTDLKPRPQTATSTSTAAATGEPRLRLRPLAAVVR